MVTLHAPPHLLAEGEELRDRHPDLQGHLFATSGTTGSPKWILHSQAGLDHCAGLVNAHFGCTSEDTWGLALPEFHVGGYCLTHRAYLAGGRLAKFDQRWDGVAYTEWLRKEEVTLTSLVPTQVHDLVTLKQVSPPKLRVALIGGAHLTEDLFAKAVALGWPLVVSYGMTETAGLIAASRLHSQDLIPLPSWELATTPEGLLTLSGPGLFSGTLTKEAFLSASTPWTTTDRADVTSHTLTLLGRADDQVKILGELVDIEHLRRHLAALVPECPTALLSLPDSRRSHLLYPVVEGPLAPELLERITGWSESLPGFSRLEPAQFMTCLPRTTLGKIDHPTLRKLITKRHSSPLPSSANGS